MPKIMFNFNIIDVVKVCVIKVVRVPSIDGRYRYT